MKLDNYEFRSFDQVSCEYKRLFCTEVKRNIFNSFEFNNLRVNAAAGDLSFVVVATADAFVAAVAPTNVVAEFDFADWPNAEYLVVFHSNYCSF